MTIGVGRHGEAPLHGDLPEEQPAAFFVPPRSAYVPQVPRLFSEPLKDNVLLGLSEEAADLSGSLWSAVLERDVETLEQEVETVVGPRGVKLSGGRCSAPPQPGCSRVSQSS
jgi:ATP-binding cassette subfamily B protein